MRMPLQHKQTKSRPSLLLRRDHQKNRHRRAGQIRRHVGEQGPCLGHRARPSRAKVRRPARAQYRVQHQHQASRRNRVLRPNQASRRNRVLRLNQASRRNRVSRPNQAPARRHKVAYIGATQPHPSSTLMRDVRAVAKSAEQQTPFASMMALLNFQPHERCVIHTSYHASIGCAVTRRPHRA